MQTIELYIQGQRVELFKDESVSLTQSIQNAKDPAKIFTDFSKSFTVPASKTNNKIFKHYYNFDIVGGFDARLKVSANIELNSLPFRKGFIQLNGVDLKNNKADIYRITFFGETVNLKDLVGEDNLSALSWLDNFTVNYDTTSIKTYLQNGFDRAVGGVLYTDAVVVPLITHTDRLFYDSTSGHSHDDINNLYYEGGSGHEHGVLWNQLKYSIRLHLIIKAIEQNYNIQFSSDFFSDANSTWHNLYMWMHRKKGSVESGIGAQTFSKVVDSFDEGSLTIPNIESDGTTISVSIFNETFSEISISTASANPYSVIVYKDGDILRQENNLVGNYTVDLGRIYNGNYIITLLSEFSITFSSIVWEFTQGDIDENFSATAVSIPATFSFYPTQQLPEIKVIDFLTGIFRMFNLTAYVEDDIIVVKELDSFYSSATPYDITKYIDVNKSSVDVALPYKQIDFEYSDYKTYLALIFNQLNAKQYGELKYKGVEEQNWVGDIYKVTLPFQKIQYERLPNLQTNALTTIQYGYFVDDNQQSYIGKPLIHYVNRQTGGTPLSVRNGDGTHSQVTIYYIPLNQNGITLSVQSLHFGEEVSEYNLRENPNVNTQSLFENYYLNYIQDVFNTKRRIIKMTAYLPLSVLLKYKLSDTFIVAGVSYKINSITTNLENGKSELELLNEV
jgi:hypothetical protein